MPLWMTMHCSTVYYAKPQRYVRVRDRELSMGNLRIFRSFIRKIELALPKSIDCRTFIANGVSAKLRWKRDSCIQFMYPISGPDPITNKKSKATNKNWKKAGKKGSEIEICILHGCDMLHIDGLDIYTCVCVSLAFYCWSILILILLTTKCQRHAHTRIDSQFTSVQHAEYCGWFYSTNHQLSLVVGVDLEFI